jgi:hypothetical protein
MIIGVSQTGQPVDVSRKLPVQPVKPVPPVFRGLEQPAATFERGSTSSPLQFAYGPPSRMPGV